MKDQRCAFRLHFVTSVHMTVTTLHPHPTTPSGKASLAGSGFSSGISLYLKKYIQKNTRNSFNQHVKKSTTKPSNQLTNTASNALFS